jgi:hypothetical protein
MYINNNNKRYHRNRETFDISDTCIHDRSLYWSGTYTLIIIIIKDIIETEKQSISLTHVYNDRSLYWSGTCTLIIIIIKDIIEIEKQWIPLTHVYMTVHCTGLVHVH